MSSGQSLCERLTRAPGPAATTVNDAGYIGELFARAPEERFVGSVCGGVSDELRDRLPFDRSRLSDLGVKFRIETQTSHT
jgi:hypothetical protein